MTPELNEFFFEILIFIWKKKRYKYKNKTELHTRHYSTHITSYITSIYFGQNFKKKNLSILFLYSNLKN